MQAIYLENHPYDFGAPKIPTRKMPISTITYFSKIFADRYAICTVEHRKE
jgi:hypothetical protein